MTIGDVKLTFDNMCLVRRSVSLVQENESCTQALCDCGMLPAWATCHPYMEERPEFKRRKLECALDPKEGTEADGTSDDEPLPEPAQEADGTSDDEELASGGKSIQFKVPKSWLRDGEGQQHPANIMLKHLMQVSSVIIENRQDLATLLEKTEVAQGKKDYYKLVFKFQESQAETRGGECMYKFSESPSGPLVRYLLGMLDKG